MELIRGLHNLRRAHQGCVLTIGNFDGVHLGHRAVIGELNAQAARYKLPSTVMIFEPAPREYFDPQNAPARLSTLREKVTALAAAGVERVICARFDAKMAAMSAQTFIDELICQRLAVRHLIVGDDFRFGHKRQGDYALLRAAGVREGFDVAATPSFLIDGVRVSSTAVRAALAAGELAAAQRMLGRPYSMCGRVRLGQQLGRQLGYPTANIAPQRHVLPLHGVFAVRVRGAGADQLPAVASLGTRPTVQGREALLEVHLFDFDEPLYGRFLAVEFVARLRDELTFPDLPALVAQMHRDAQQARRLLARS